MRPGSLYPLSKYCIGITNLGGFVLEDSYITQVVCPRAKSKLATHKPKYAEIKPPGFSRQVGIFIP